jgi:succinate dehydrogenase/fumarate reductase-like Fe-S protein
MNCFRLHLRRGPGLEGSLQTYELNGEESEKLVDLIQRIQREIDPTLAYRASCLTGKCGTCAMKVNGRTRLSCQEMLRPGEHVVEASPAGTVIWDLVCFSIRG